MMSVTTSTDLRQLAQDVVDEMIQDPWGHTTPSVYETARLVTSAAWLDGHQERVEFLLAQQHKDGTWGGPEAYALLPTLSAVEALLAVAATDGTQRIWTAARAGLAALTERFTPDVELPDTIAVEFLAPWLVEQINQRLAQLDDQGVLASTGMPRRLDVPVDTRPLKYLREHLASAGIPEKTWHSLEALGAPAVRSPMVTPAYGAVGASPAATVAWLGDPPHADGDVVRACLEYLRQTQARHGGPVSGITSITYFEQAWVSVALCDAGLRAEVPAQLADSLQAALGSAGLPAGPGLPADSDDTSAALHALHLIGRPTPVDCLWEYDAGSYFRCFPGERTPSISTNAHILLALADPGQPGDERRSRAAERVGAWLLEQQDPDGSWIDKWHASPYYATACCVAALASLRDPRGSAAVDNAARWVLATQRPDGSWGRWAGTREETAYAIRVLGYSAASDQATVDAIRRGRAFLIDNLGDHVDDAPLWHDKDLYAPLRVIRAEVLAALAVTRHLDSVDDRALS